MKITFKHKGNFNKIEHFLYGIKRGYLYKHLDKYGQKGVDALSNATPVRSGITASSWGYEIEETDSGPVIRWTNSNEKNGWYNVAIGIQLGHGTGTGGWVEGIDYINPALRPIFEKMVEEIWIDVQNL